MESDSVPTFISCRNKRIWEGKRQELGRLHMERQQRVASNNIRNSLLATGNGSMLTMC